MEYKHIVLKSTTNKFVVINPCGAKIQLSSGTIAGLKPVTTRATVNEINRCLRAGFKVSELLEGVRSTSSKPLILTDSYRVFSESHLEFLKKINTGYIDDAEEIFAGTKITPQVPYGPHDKVPVTSVAARTDWDWTEYVEVLKVLSKSDVNNKVQVINEYQKTVLNAVARRIADSEGVAKIIANFKDRTYEDTTLNTKIATFVAALTTAIKSDIYNNVVSIEDEPVVNIEEEIVEEPAAEEVVESSEEVVEELPIVENTEDEAVEESETEKVDESEDKSAYTQPERKNNNRNKKRR